MLNTCAKRRYVQKAIPVHSLSPLQAPKRPNQHVYKSFRIPHAFHSKHITDPLCACFYINRPRTHKTNVLICAYNTIQLRDDRPYTPNLAANIIPTHPFVVFDPKLLFTKCYNKPNGGSLLFPVIIPHTNNSSDVPLHSGVGEAGGADARGR